MKPIPPVNPLLDLWALGHSAAQVAEMLGVEGGAKRVSYIVAQARSIGDKRAVLHVASTGRLVGRPGRMKQPPVAITVPSIGKPRCYQGHPRTPENIYPTNKRCRECERVRRRKA